MLVLLNMSCEDFKTFQACRALSEKPNTKEITVFIAIRFELKTYVYKPILFIIHSVIER